MKSRNAPGTGIITLLVIFATLCLMVLGFGAYASFASTSATAQKALENMQAVQTSECELEEKLAEIDGVLWGLQQRYSSPDEYFLQAFAQLKAMGYKVQESSRTASVTVPVGKEREWVLELKVLNPSEEYRYTVLRKMLRSTAHWQPDQSVQLLVPAQYICKQGCFAGETSYKSKNL